LIGRLAGHLAMGAGLGTMLALALVVSNAGGLFGMIINGGAPATMLGVLVGVLAAMFGVGAALTGMIFIEMERH
jgi:hypothetical protein